MTDHSGLQGAFVFPQIFANSHVGGYDQVSQPRINRDIRPKERFILPSNAPRLEMPDSNDAPNAAAEGNGESGRAKPSRMVFTSDTWEHLVLNMEYALKKHCKGTAVWDEIGSLMTWEGGSLTGLQVKSRIQRLRKKRVKQLKTVPPTIAYGKTGLFDNVKIAQSIEDNLSLATSKSRKKRKCTVSRRKSYRETAAEDSDSSESGPKDEFNMEADYDQEFDDAFESPDQNDVEPVTKKVKSKGCDASGSEDSPESASAVGHVTKPSLVLHLPVCLSNRSDLPVSMPGVSGLDGAMNSPRSVRIAFTSSEPDVAGDNIPGPPNNSPNRGEQGCNDYFVPALGINGNGDFHTAFVMPQADMTIPNGRVFETANNYGLEANRLTFDDADYGIADGQNVSGGGFNHGCGQPPFVLMESLLDIHVTPVVTPSNTFPDLMQQQYFQPEQSYNAVFPSHPVANAALMPGLAEYDFGHEILGMNQDIFVAPAAYSGIAMELGDQTFTESATGPNAYGMSSFTSSAISRTSTNMSPPQPFTPAMEAAAVDWKSFLELDKESGVQ